MTCGESKTCEAMPPVCTHETFAPLNGKCACKLQRGKHDDGKICKNGEMCDIWEHKEYEYASCMELCPTLPSVFNGRHECACNSINATGHSLGHSLCIKGLACLDGTCYLPCTLYPYYSNKTDLCMCSTTTCSTNTEICKDDTCQALPPDCEISAIATASCTCRGKDGGAVCEQEEICFVSTTGRAECLQQCPEYPQIHQEPISNTSCECKGENETNPCSVDQVCRKPDATCLDQCYTSPLINWIHYHPCFCKITQTDCDINEVCDTDGCFTECSSDEVITEEKCYCGKSKTCEKDKVCHKTSDSTDSCIPECPPPVTTITEDICYCMASMSTCARDQICNNLTAECSEPFPVCPAHPNLSLDGPCACQDKVCPQHFACTAAGTCEDPGTCPLNQTNEKDFCLCKSDPGELLLFPSHIKSNSVYIQL